MEAGGQTSAMLQGQESSGCTCVILQEDEKVTQRGNRDQQLCHFHGGSRVDKLRGRYISLSCQRAKAASLPHPWGQRAEHPPEDHSQALELKRFALLAFRLAWDP